MLHVPVILFGNGSEASFQAAEIIEKAKIPFRTVPIQRDEPMVRFGDITVHGVAGIEKFTGMLVDLRSDFLKDFGTKHPRMAAHASPEAKAQAERERQALYEQTLSVLNHAKARQSP